ncbi:DMT family transporter [Anaerobacillus sp. MEB173]|uniref:DMT family transporter n=1 Tax=Anaerobacillus sp. MEB173 TaxID=3383345 RepID=UPI003F8F52D3
MKKPLKMYLILIGVMMVWGLSVSVIKFLVENNMPITITSLRIFVASVLVFIVLGFLGKVRLPKKSEWLYIFGGSLLSVAIHHYFLADGLTKTSASNAGLILGMGPILTVVLSMIFLRNRPSFLRSLGFIFGGLGVSFTILSGGNGMSSVSVGDINIFLSILSQACSFILISHASKTMNPGLLTGYMFLIGSFILFITSLVIEPNGLATLAIDQPLVWLAFLFTVLTTGLGHMLYNFAIRQVGPAETSIFLNLNTFFALVGAALFLNEAILVSHFIGFVFIATGVVLGSGAFEMIIRQKKNKAVLSKREV